MDWDKTRNRERGFLHEQASQVAHKITRFENALEICNECLEAEGLRRMLEGAYLERTLLDELLIAQNASDALALEAIILQRIECFQKQARRLSHNWRRGKPTPPGYWEAQQKQHFMEALLRELHAWRDGRPLYATANGRNGAVPSSRKPLPDPTHFGRVYNHPWFLAGRDTRNGAASTAEEKNPEPEPEPRPHLSECEIETVHELIEHALDEIDFEADQLDIIVESDRRVILTGYAPSEDAREEVINTILQLDDVEEIISDIKIGRANLPRIQ